MPKHTFYPIGSISSGTLRDEDLFATFANELESLANNRRTCVRAKTRLAHRRLVAELWVEHDNPSEDADLAEMCDELSRALEEYAAPYFYFGALEGDGAEFGFYVDSSLFDDPGYFDGLKVADLSEVPRGYRGEVLHINDHGNATLYVATRRGLREVWAIV